MVKVDLYKALLYLWTGMEERGYIYNDSTCQGQAHIHIKFLSGGPPSLRTPCYAQTNYGLFFIIGPNKEHFWSSPKNHNFG